MPIVQDLCTGHNIGLKILIMDLHQITTNQVIKIKFITCVIVTVVTMAIMVIMATTILTRALIIKTITSAVPTIISLNKISRA